jgi:hypothetical protein
MERAHFRSVKYTENCAIFHRTYNREHEETGANADTAKTKLSVYPEIEGKVTLPL